MYKRKLRKNKRCKVSWITWLWFLKNYDVISDFSKSRENTKVKSLDRIAYNVLKKYYSTTAIGAMRYLWSQSKEKGIPLNELLSSYSCC